MAGNENKIFVSGRITATKRRSPQQPREPDVLDRKTGGAVAKRS
jgi:hypothetical protein